jgi:RNA polymerase sigma factor for flagellar operon FliA
LEASGDVASNPQFPSEGPQDGEAALWREFTVSGSASARQKLFDLHRAFARQIAVKHFLDRKSGDIEFADLCQLAFAGLLEALDRYDPSRSITFRAFARRRITGSILDGLSHLSEMREQISFRNRVRKERLKSLTVENAEQLDAPEAMAALIEMATGLALGFMIEGSGLYIAEDESDTRSSPYETLAWKQLVSALRDEITRLPPQESKVVTYHYLNGLSFDQISKIVELSKGRVSQIHRSSLKSLREGLYRGGGFIYEK